MIAHRLLEPAKRTFSPDGIGKFFLCLSGRELINEVLHDTVLMDLVLTWESKIPFRCVFDLSGKGLIHLAGHQGIGKIDSLSGLCVSKTRENVIRLFDRLDDLLQSDCHFSQHLFLNNTVVDQNMHMVLFYRKAKPCTTGCETILSVYGRIVFAFIPGPRPEVFPFTLIAHHRYEKKILFI